MSRESYLRTTQVIVDSTRVILLEVLLLIITIWFSIVMVSALVYLPRAIATTNTSENGAGATAYLTGILTYLRELLHGNLGRTSRGRFISSDILPAAFRTLQLLGISVFVAVPLGTIWGTVLAFVQKPLLKSWLVGIHALILAIPSFVVLILLQRLIASITFQTGVQLLPVQGYGLDKHLVLPVTVLALQGAATLARILQISYEDALHQDWVRVARAKGLGGFSLWRNHLLPVLRLPILGGILGTLRILVSATIIIDYVSQWNGLGGQMLRVEPSSLIRPTDERIAAGAALLFVLFFAITDGLARVLVRAAEPRLRSGKG